MSVTINIPKKLPKNRAKKEKTNPVFSETINVYTKEVVHSKPRLAEESDKNPEII
jgi:hypothetical protein